ncbi:MAG: PorP/SprF family type IX secretion system membrane protein [Bacteroidota bacterium]|nr:PorP/SprF family type IX secretion system membrane protein [Bacteroidota bacterium]
MIKKILLIIVIFLSLCGSLTYAQDPEFSQFYANPLYLNPAFAGTTMCPRVVLNYRNQWPALPGTFVTYNASYDQYIEAISGGLGVSVLDDRAGQGTINTINLNVMYSYRLVVSRTFSMHASLEASYFQKKLDWGKLTFGDMINEKDGFIYKTQETQPQLSKGYVDFTSGFLGYSENYFAGISFSHMTQPQEGFMDDSKLPMRITVHGGAVLGLKKRKGKRKLNDPTISPNILYMQQRDFKQINYGFYFNKYPMVGGLWFRHTVDNPDALIALIGVQQGMFKVGYSYDLTVSKLSNASGGAHELSLGIQFECRPKKKKLRAISCPSF